MDFLVHVDQIREHGLDWNRTLPVEDLARMLTAEPPTGYSPVAPAAIAARLSKVNEGNVLFAGKFVLEASVECRRCLGPVAVKVPVEFRLDLIDSARVAELTPSAPPEDDENAEVAGSFAPEEADQIFFQGKEIDLFPILREQVLLALPLYVTCREGECQGLCQVCGANLNEVECGCERKILDPRLAALKDIKLS
jgi:uncharacterized protein